MFYMSVSQSKNTNALLLRSAISSPKYYIVTSITTSITTTIPTTITTTITTIITTTITTITIAFIQREVKDVVRS